MIPCSDFDIIQHYSYFLTVLQQFVDHIHNDLQAFPIWIADKQQLSHNRAKLLAAVSLLSHSGDSGQETFSCPGLFGGNEQTILLQKKLNDAKDAFQQIVQHFLKQESLMVTTVVRDILAKAGFPHVKLRQVYRHIKQIPFHPRRVSFGFAKSSSHRIISAIEAERLLYKVGKGANIDIQLKKVYELSDSDSLVIVRQIKPVWVANAATFKNEDGLSHTLKIRTSLPLVYYQDMSRPKPDVQFAKVSLKRGERSDRQLEEEPFLPSISAYRYKQ